MSTPRPLALLLLLLAPALAWGQGAPRTSRSRVSATGVFAVRLVEEAPGRCRLEVSRENGAHWALARCVGTVDDLYFVSADGERVWVLYPLAEKAPRTRKSTGATAWARTPVARLYDRTGALLAQRLLTDLTPRKALGKVRQLKGHVKWLPGTLDVPGVAPRLTDAGLIEFDTVDGKRHQLQF